MPQSVLPNTGIVSDVGSLWQKNYGSGYRIIQEGPFAIIQFAADPQGLRNIVLDFASHPIAVLQQVALMNTTMADVDAERQAMM